MKLIGDEKERPKHRRKRNGNKKPNKKKGKGNKKLKHPKGNKGRIK
jgi:hypothetical protein